MLLIKRTENTLHIRRIHTNTGITHPDHQIQHVIPDHHLTECNNNFTFRYKFYGIGKEVDNNLIHAQFITNHIIYGNIFKINCVTSYTDIRS